MITASIVSYHHPVLEIKRIVDCLLDVPIETIYIIDNSSNDSLRKLEKLSDKICYIHSENRGYGTSHNIAIRESINSGSQYHVIINPDIYFEPKVICILSKYMDQHADVGLIMPKVIYPNGELQYLCKLLPTPEDLILRRFFGKDWFLKKKYKFELRFSQYNKKMEVPFLSGCFMFLRIDALLKVGLFDERFFMYGEDIDLSRRIHQVYRTIFLPDVTIIHAHEAASYKNRKMMFIHIQNIIRYFNKWGWFFDKERQKINQKILAQLGYRN